MKESSRIRIKIPPPIVTLLFGVLMYFLDPIYHVEVSIGVRDVLILSLLLASLILLLPAVVQFFKNKTTVNPFKPEKSKVLVVAGVYRYSRNPMYLGMAAVLLAWAVYLSNPINVVTFLCFILYINYFQIKPEENALEDTFGEDFKCYKSKVRRWL